MLCWRQQTYTELISNQPSGSRIMVESLLGVIPSGQSFLNYSMGWGFKMECTAFSDGWGGCGSGGRAGHPLIRSLLVRSATY